MKAFIFYYHMKEDAELIRDTAAEHADYWKDRKILGGSFCDFSGGFILFKAQDLREAQLMIHQDAFLEEGAIKDFELKEWKMDQN